MAKTNKPSFRQTVEEYHLIIGELKKKHYRPVYLLMGEEPYFIDRISRYATEHILDEAGKSFDQTVLYGKDTTGADVVSACRQFPMIAPRQVIVVREAQQLRNIDELQHYANAPLASTILILCYKGKSMDKRSALYKKLAGKALVFESVAPRDYEMGDWVQSVFRSRGVMVESKAVAMVVEKLGADLSKLENELDKLFTGLPQGTRAVTEDDIEKYIGISKDFNSFELTAALSRRDAAKAMMIADHFARNQKDNPLVVTIQTLFTHFLRIFTVGYMKWQAERSRRPFPSDMELMKRLRLSNAFFVKEYVGAVNLYPTQKSFAILGMIREYDMKSKGVNGGSSDNGELLKELIIKILSI